VVIGAAAPVIFLAAIAVAGVQGREQCEFDMPQRKRKCISIGA
jgi:hypothetical protein